MSVPGYFLKKAMRLKSAADWACENLRAIERDNDNVGEPQARQHILTLIGAADLAAYEALETLQREASGSFFDERYEPWFEVQQ